MNSGEAVSHGPPSGPASSISNCGFPWLLASRLAANCCSLISTSSGSKYLGSDSDWTSEGFIPSAVQIAFLPRGRRTCYLHAKSFAAPDYALPMATRTRFLITTAVLCHLILTTRLVTSQLLAVAPPQKTGISSSNRGPGPAIISALHQEKDSAVYKLRGNVRIEYASYIFSGDNVIYDSDSGDVT